MEQLHKCEHDLKKSLEEAIKAQLKVSKSLELHANAPDDFEKQQEALRKAAQAKFDANYADKKSEVDKISDKLSKVNKDKTKLKENIDKVTSKFE